MKKIVILALSILCVLGIAAGCGCSKDGDSPASSAPSQSAASTPSAPSDAESASPAPDESAGEPAQDTESSGEESGDPSVALPEVSENKEVVTEENAPKLYILANADSNVDQITYHLAGCPLLEGKEIQEVSYEFLQMVGYWQCPQCNPPRYENYKNAE